MLLWQTPHHIRHLSMQQNVLFLSWAYLAWRKRGWGVTLLLSTCTWKEVVASWALVSSSVPPDPRPCCLLLWFSPVTLPLCSSMSPLFPIDLWNHSTAAVLYLLGGTGWCPCAVCQFPWCQQPETAAGDGLTECYWNQQWSKGQILTPGKVPIDVSKVRILLRTSSPEAETGKLSQ